MKEDRSVLGPGWPIFLFLLLAVIPSTFTSTLLAPGLPALATQLGDGADGVRRAQLLMSIPGVAMMLAPLAGWLADRIGNRRVLLASLALDTIAGLAGLLTDNFALLLVIRFVLGIGVGGLMAVSLSMIGDYYNGEARGRMLGYRWAALSAYSIGAVQAAGYLSMHFSWSAPLLLYALGVPLFLFALVCVRPNRERPDDKQVDAGLPLPPPPPLRETITWTFGLAMVGNIFLAICMYNNYAQLPFLLKEKGYSAITYANVMIPMSLAAIVAAAFLFPRLRRTLHPLAILALALVAFAAGTFGFAMAENAAHLLLAAILVGSATAMFETALSSFLLDKVHPSRRAMTMGGIFSTYHIGPFLIPFLLGGISSRHGFAAAFDLLAFVAVAGAIVLFVGLRGRLVQRPATITA